MNEAIAVTAENCEQDDVKLQELRLENVELKVQLHCQEEVIQKIQTSLVTEEKLLNEKREKIWSNAVKFMEESNKFHQEFGISSAWWNAQIMSLQQPDIENTGGINKQKQIALESVQTEIEKNARDVQVQNEEITQLKNKITTHDAEIVEQKMMEEMLQKEPFGAEFASLKLKLHRSKDTCQQLQTVVVNSERTLIRKRRPESLGNCHPTIMTQKVIRTEESTTFVYKTSYGKRNGNNQLEYDEL